MKNNVFEFIEDSFQRILIEDLKIFKSSEDAERSLKNTIYNYVVSKIIPRANVKFLRDNWDRVTKNIDRSVEKMNNAHTFVVFSEDENETKKSATDTAFIILKILMYIKDNEGQDTVSMYINKLVGERITDLLIQFDPQIKNIIDEVYASDRDKINECFNEWNYNVKKNIEKYSRLINQFMNITIRGKEDGEK